MLNLNILQLIRLGFTCFQQSWKEQGTNLFNFLVKAQHGLVDHVDVINVTCRN